jgi:hypothetical protein
VPLEATHTAQWTSGGDILLVTLRPLLPNERTCTDLDKDTHKSIARRISLPHRRRLREHGAQRPASTLPVRHRGWQRTVIQTASAEAGGHVGPDPWPVNKHDQRPTTAIPSHMWALARRSPTTTHQLARRFVELTPRKLQRGNTAASASLDAEIRVSIQSCDDTAHDTSHPAADPVLAAILANSRTAGVSRIVGHTVLQTKGFRPMRGTKDSPVNGRV